MVMDKFFDNDFARFALALYANSQLANVCLLLQDKHGIDVNLLLWATWLDHNRIETDATLWRAGEVAVGFWQMNIVKPLRWVRRRSKSVKWCYRQVKDWELWAESVAMERLYEVVRQRQQSGCGVEISPDVSTCVIASVTMPVTKFATKFVTTVVTASVSTYVDTYLQQMHCEQYSDCWRQLLRSIDLSALSAKSG